MVMAEWLSFMCIYVGRTVTGEGHKGIFLGAGNAFFLKIRVLVTHMYSFCEN